MAIIIKRTFKALEAETERDRQRLNQSLINSDFKPSYKYVVVDFQEHSEIPFKTKEEAQEFINN